MIQFEPEPNGYKKPKVNSRKSILQPWRWRVVYIGYLVMVVILTILILIMGGKADGRTHTEPYTITITEAEIEAADAKKSMEAAIQEDDTIYPEDSIITSRASREPIIMECTAYTLREQECGKAPGDPGYGITASGASVEPWHTIAAPQSIPFGTRIYIPYFSDAPNGGVFTVQDRGGAVVEGCLDIYMESLEDALQFGRRDLEVYILGE